MLSLPSLWHSLEEAVGASSPLALNCTPNLAHSFMGHLMLMSAPGSLHSLGTGMSPRGSSLTNPLCHDSIHHHPGGGPPWGTQVPMSYRKLSPGPGDGGKPCAELETEIVTGRASTQVRPVAGGCWGHTGVLALMVTLLVLLQHECLSVTSQWQCGARCLSVHPSPRLGTTAWEEELDGATAGWGGTAG